MREEETKLKLNNLYDILRSDEASYSSSSIDKSATDIVRRLDLLQKIALNTNAEEFQSFILNNEVPPIKLSSEEMEFLKGGGPLRILRNIKKYGENALGACNRVARAAGAVMDLYQAESMIFG